MPQFNYEYRASRTIEYAVLTAAACLSIYWYLQPVLSPGDPVKPTRVIFSKARQAAKLALADSTRASSLAPRKLAPSYAPYVFPGGRDVETAYGTIKVFEWGPEDGEKVLLLHGIGTPCVALGDMAREFVRKGCRVMLFGELATFHRDTLLFSFSFLFPKLLAISPCRNQVCKTQTPKKKSPVRLYFSESRALI